MEFNLRTAIQSDVSEIAQIHVSSWNSAFKMLMPEGYINCFTVSSRVKEWQGVIKTNTESVVVALREGKIVGFMSYFINPDNAKIIELSKLYLCPSIYGQKLGSKLLTHLEQQSRSLGKKTIRLYVLDNNEAAIQFYLKHGFEFTGSFVSEEFEGVVMNDLLMVKQV